MFKKTNLILIAIVIFAFFLRIYGIDWDQGQHLHPDERFLTMVSTAMQMPNNLHEYFNQSISKLNPANIGFTYYVYGIVPLVITKYIALKTNMNGYGELAIVGRLLSAIFDIFTLMTLYLFAKTIIQKYNLNKYLPTITIFIYSLMVFPIQLAHFYTVESCLTFFTIVSFYYMYKWILNKKIILFILSAICWGIAFSCKISAIYYLPLLFFGAFFNFFYKKHLLNSIVKGILFLVFFIFLSYISIRIANPYYFQNVSLLNIQPNTLFIQNIKQTQQLSTPEAGYFPPAIQWYDRIGLVFALFNIGIFGLGLPLFILLLIGIVLIIKKRIFFINILLLYLFVLFIYLGNQFSPSMRYFIVFYPLFAFFISFGFLFIYNKLSQYLNKYIAGLFIIVFAFIWTFGFIHIYSAKHSRVQASEWIHTFIPAGSTIATEHWDDALPLQLSNYQNRTYNMVSLPVFGQDDIHKWKEITMVLNKSDYIIFSSNRGYGSIMRQKDMYPKMSLWYKDLFNNKTQFKKIKEFTSYPKWCIPLTNTCYEFNDQWAEEAFSVYDHPKVTVFQKNSE